MSERPARAWEGVGAEALARRWGAPAVHLFESVGSTSDVARRLAAAGAAPGTVVLAEEQTAGRGRAGRRWTSPPGVGLWFSVIAAPRADTGRTLLPLRVGLAVAQALDALAGGARVGIKWPNDLCVGERKLGGILCEASWEGARAGVVVAGVGLNLLQKAGEFPPEMRGGATSLAIEARGFVERLESADRVIPAVLGACDAGGPLDAAELAAKDLLRGHPVSVTDPMTGRSIVAGVAEGIGADGALLVRDSAGALHRITSGTVRRTYGHSSSFVAPTLGPRFRGDDNRRAHYKLNDTRTFPSTHHPMHSTTTAEVRVPGDKSLTHRALMFAAAARGESHLSGLLPGADCRSTAAVLAALGVEIPALPADGGAIRVRSEGIAAWRQPGETLDCGNSGTTVRLMMGLLAGRPFCSTLTGDASLRSRPMRRITDPLGEMGARVRELASADRLPVELCGGPLRPIAYRSPKASAQIKSALLLAGLSAGVPVEVWEPGLSRDHTERILRSLGVDVTGKREGDGWRVGLQPPSEPLPPLEMEVPGDPSSAAFVLSVALLAREGEVLVPNVGINPTRTGFFAAVARMGGRVELLNERESGGEPVGDLLARPARLKGIEVGGAEVPSMIDELPVLAVLAARAEGDTIVRGAEELRAKESDRITAMVDNLRAIGADAEELPDGFVVRGSDRPLAGRVRTYHDHRIAMAFGVLGALPGNDLDIEAPEIVDVSFPGFWETVQGLGGRQG